MANLNKIFKLILLLTIFNACISLKFDTENTNSNLFGGNEVKLINISFYFEGEKPPEKKTNLTDEISSFELTGENLMLQFYAEDDTNITIFPYHINKENITYDNESVIVIVENNLTQFKIKTKQISNTTEIAIKVSETGSSKIYKVSKNKYVNIPKEDDFSPLEVENKQIIRFMDKKEEEIIFKLNFKDNCKNEEISYGIICLPTNDVGYLPNVQSFKLNNEKINTEPLNDNNNFEGNMRNPFHGNNDCGHIAFILSTNHTDIKTATINEDKVMTYFLYGSIILALIFAVITFFLIRRKQNISNDVENEDNVDDNDK